MLGLCANVFLGILGANGPMLICFEARVPCDFTTVSYLLSTNISNNTLLLQTKSNKRNGGLGHHKLERGAKG